MSRVDPVIKAGTQEAIAMAITLAREEALFVKKVVTILPDRGDPGVHFQPHALARDVL